MNGLWYCPAYCTVANQIREFRIDRIKEIIEEKPYPKGKFPVPASIQEYLERLEIGNDWVADYFLSFGNNATVLEPPELVELMKQKTYELHQHYCR